MTKRSAQPQHRTGTIPRTARLNRLFQEILAEELELIDDDRLEMVTIMSRRLRRRPRATPPSTTTPSAARTTTTRCSRPSARHRHRLQGPSAARPA